MKAHSAYDFRKNFYLQQTGFIFMRFIPFFLIMISTIAPAYAQGDVMEPADGRLLAAYDGVGSFSEHDMGLELTLDNQWYTYWRNPGEAGLAPTFDWSASQNVKEVEILWPAPKRFQALDLYSFGYDETVILPLNVIPEETGKDVTLNLKLDIVVCHEICIPQTLTLPKTLSGKTAGRSDEYKILREARSNLPVTENTKDFGIETAVLGKDAIILTAYSKQGFSESMDVFMDSPDIVVTAVPEILPEDEDGKKAIIKLAVPEGIDPATALFGKTINIVLVNGEQAIESRFTF